MEKYCTAGQATDDNMAHAHCMLDTRGYKHILRMCNTYCRSTTTVFKVNVPHSCVIIHCLFCRFHVLSCRECILFLIISRPVQRWRLCNLYSRLMLMDGIYDAVLSPPLKYLCLSQHRLVYYFFIMMTINISSTLYNLCRRIVRKCFIRNWYVSLWIVFIWLKINRNNLNGSITMCL